MHWKHWNGIIHIFGVVLCGIDPAAVFPALDARLWWIWMAVGCEICRTHTERSLPTTTTPTGIMAMPTTATSALSMVYAWNDGVIDFDLTCRWTCISNYICRVVCPCFSVSRTMHGVWHADCSSPVPLFSVCMCLVEVFVRLVVGFFWPAIRTVWNKLS